MRRRRCIECKGKRLAKRCFVCWPSVDTSPHVWLAELNYKITKNAFVCRKCADAHYTMHELARKLS